MPFCTIHYTKEFLERDQGGSLGFSRPSLGVAVWNSYEYFCLWMWSDDTSYELVHLKPTGAFKYVNTRNSNAQKYQDQSGFESLIF